ncbi:hypothetical protein BBJ28_00015451 [Nothophytophthora sp. Chile5]|nr:hypothetical protein BBJ28_00015451 [Nothophytophthora sp. Chile5]
MQVQFCPYAADEHHQLREDGHAMGGHISLMRGSHNGFVKLRSANPREHPIIDPNYMAEEESRVDMRTAVKLTREIFAQKAFEEFRGDGIFPKDSVQSDAEIDAWIRRNASTHFHPACSIRMGEDDNSVVDSQTRVHGLEGLRVVDASIMPKLVSGNTNAPAMMIAEKAADIILGNTPLPKSKAPVFQPKNWETSQR